MPVPIARVLHRGQEKFLAFARELLLGRFERCNAGCDFFALLRATFFLLGHCPSPSV